MQLRPAFPVDAVGGSCFVTLGYELREGEQVIDLDRDLEAMPMWGRLCLLPDAVRAMNTLLGWEVDGGMADKLKERETTISQLRAEIVTLRDALTDVLRAGEVVGVETSIDRELVDG